MQDPRQALLSQLEQEWDIVIIGGGATGLSCGWDAVSRGFKTLVIEAEDFAAATSSRSTKLIHGGVRYLQQFDLPLVKEALRERSLLLKNAPEFCQPLHFILPVKSFSEKIYYRTGLAVYDLLAGFSSPLQKSKNLSLSETAEKIPTLNLQNVKGGVQYSDAQFDDSGLAIALAQAINANGGCAINYSKLKKFIEKDGRINGAIISDCETHTEFTISAKLFINATGVFANQVRDTNNINYQQSVITSRGSHIVVPKTCFPTNHALIIPKTSDGRVLFAIPWKNHTIFGTTDEATQSICYNPRPSEKEIHFLLDSAHSYLGINKMDILSQWSGLRPLVVSNKNNKATKKISRNHQIEISPNGLISILGGKWTTARAMAEDTLDAATKEHGLSNVPSRTAQLKLTENGALQPFCGTFKNAFSHYYARNLSDFLARRERIEFLNHASTRQKAQESIQEVARYRNWNTEQADQHLQNYLNKLESK